MVKQTIKRGEGVQKKKQDTANTPSSAAPVKKMSEYGRQLAEKQKVKEMYGLREKQFRRFFHTAARMEGTPGENLLSLLERRLDNTLYRLKLATTRPQARQAIVHGHVCVNGRRVYSPSFLVKTSDVVTLREKTIGQHAYMEQALGKRVKMGIKVPDWLQLDKQTYTGQVLRNPVRTDIQTPIEEYLIVELYSK